MIDLDRLLAPIDDASPTGRNLRYVDGDLTFQSIGDARAEDDPALVLDGDAKTADWRKVISECEQALASKTKDLEIAGWLAEGLAHREGFAGVRDGLRLIRELVEGHWQRLHPGFDESDGEIILTVRAKPLSWLALPRCFLLAVKSIPMATGNGRSLSYADYELAQRYAEARGNNQALFQQLVEAGAATTEEWRSVLVGTPVGELDDTLSSVRECRAELELLIKLCEDRFGDQAPLLRPLDDLLADIGDQVERANRGESANAGPEERAAGAQGATTATAASGLIATRHDALRVLSQVADFFRRTEPHSPISYLVQRAVRWGSMPLEELLREVVKDSSALEHIWETLGMQKPREGD